VCVQVIPNVLMMNNQVPDFQKFPIAVAASQAEKNYLAKQVRRMTDTHTHTSTSHTHA
jgi:hypothetical protein